MVKSEILSSEVPMQGMIAQLPQRGVLEIQGEDKATFLQGLVSNDIFDVTPEQAIYAVLLTPQGRFLYDLFIAEKNGSFLIDAETQRLEALLKRLTLYKLRSQVNLQLRPDLKVFAIWGLTLSETLGLKEESGSAREGLFMDPRLLQLGARGIGEVKNMGFQQATARDYDAHRLMLGVPEGGLDLIPEKTIPLEAGLDELNAISWTKGCYLGQELTARTKYRGLIRKRLFPVKIEGELPIDNKEIFLGGAEVGDMRTHNGSDGIALLRLEAFEAYEEEQGELRCGDALLKPYKPTWMRVVDPS
jgi:folate-binding protein YgfZ